MRNVIFITVLSILFFTNVKGICKFPEYFHICGRLKEPTCTDPTVPSSLNWESCLNYGPGCRCHNGYVRHSQTSTCMRKDKCFGVTLANAVKKTVDSLVTSLLMYH